MRRAVGAGKSDRGSCFGEVGEGNWKGKVWERWRVEKVKWRKRGGEVWEGISEGEVSEMSLREIRKGEVGEGKS